MIKIFFFLLCFPLIGFGQFSDDYLTDEIRLLDQNQYIRAEFSLIFKDEDKNNFKKLRKFLAEKQRKKTQYSEHLDNHYHYIKDLKRKKLRLLKRNKEFENILNSDSDSEKDDGGFFATTTNKDELKNQIDQNKKILNKDSLKLVQINMSLDIVKSSLNHLKADIDETQVTIDNALAPEYSRQKFKSNITLYFSALIGIMITLLFLVLLVKAKGDITKQLLSESGLQFVTIFVLIISVILFGVLEILQATELAAILSGISGYILGKSGKEGLEKIKRSSVDNPSSQNAEGGS